MSNVIDFLERLGGDSQLRYAPRAELERAMQEAQMSPALRMALTKSDQRLLDEQLGAASNVCCAIYVPMPLHEDEGDPRTKPKDNVKAA